MRLPSEVGGAYIPIGAALDALKAVAGVLASSKADVLIIDPYMDQTTLGEFAVTAPVNIPIRLMADQASSKPDLPPAVQRFIKQFGATRPLHARLAPPLSMHDRLIIVDRNQVSIVTQSFNKLAARSPASILRVTDPDIAQSKIAFYEDLWNKPAQVLA
jgi:hypothetical protein